MSKVLVFGATGYVGGHVVDELLGRGHSVIGVSRGIREVPVKPGLEMVTGEIFDLTDLASDADAVVVAVRAARLDPPLEAAIQKILEARSGQPGPVAIVGGAATLLVSEGGQRVMDGETFPDAAKPEAQAQAAVLQWLRGASTDVDWFYLSPARVFGAANPGERLGRYRTGGDVLVVDAEGKSHISGADYAIALVDELETPQHHQTRFTVGY